MTRDGSCTARRAGGEMSIKEGLIEAIAAFAGTGSEDAPLDGRVFVG